MADGVTLLPLQRATDPDLIQRCENLLRWAKAGTIVGLSYATVQPDGTIGSAWHVVENTKSYGNLLLAATTLLHHRLAADFDCSCEGKSPDD